MMVRVVNIGLVGAGFCASVLRLPIYEKYVPEARVIGIASRCYS